MIVAKTKMRKIPETCTKCSIAIVVHGGWNDSYRVCGATGKDCPWKALPSGNYGYAKPDWCPLIER